eukprot:SAG11_NODE_387_length_9883_cov_9.365699_12_plen_47_part_00
MLEFADTFMDQTVEPEGKVGTFMQWFHSQNAVIRAFIIITLCKLLG